MIHRKAAQSSLGGMRANGKAAILPDRLWNACGRPGAA